MSEQWTWEPVDNYRDWEYLTGPLSQEAVEELSKFLDDDEVFCLCRRVPAQGVPVEVAAILQAALIAYQTECAHLGDFEHLQMAVNARDWLDAQPQPGQAQGE